VRIGVCRLVCKCVRIVAIRIEVHYAGCGNKQNGKTIAVEAILDIYINIRYCAARNIVVAYDKGMH